MDVNMPNMDGITATKKILELMPDRASRPFICCLTANAMAEDKSRCLAAGADGYVSKPILVPALVEALTQAGIRRGTSLRPPPTISNSPTFELELPLSRLGRAGRKGSAGSVKSAGTISSNISSPSGSPLATTTSYSEEVTKDTVMSDDGGASGSVGSAASAESAT